MFIKKALQSSFTTVRFIYFFNETPQTGSFYDIYLQDNKLIRRRQVFFCLNQNSIYLNMDRIANSVLFLPTIVKSPFLLERGENFV